MDARTVNTLSESLITIADSMSASKAAWALCQEIDGRTDALMDAEDEAGLAELDKMYVAARGVATSIDANRKALWAARDRLQALAL